MLHYSSLELTQTIPSVLERYSAAFGLPAEQNDYAAAFRRMDELERIGDIWSQTYAILGQGQLEMAAGDDQAARAHLELGLKLVAQIPDEWLKTWIPVFLTPTLIRQGDLTRAKELLAESAARSRRELHQGRDVWRQSAQRQQTTSTG